MIARVGRALLATCLLAACAAPEGDSRAGAEIDRVTEASGAIDASSPPAPMNGATEDVRTSREACLVAAVSDGDSFRCATQGRVRLLLLDAPEMDQAPFGARSRDALRQRLTRSDTVWLEFDVQREDRYNRTLAHVWTAPVGGTHVNLAHARDGWAVAVVFPPNVRHIDAIRAAVAEARQQRRGLWADGRFTCEPIAHKRGDC